jgi:hypothetical protein
LFIAFVNAAYERRRGSIGETVRPVAQLVA